MKYAFTIGAVLLAAGAVFAQSPQVMPSPQAAAAAYRVVPSAQAVQPMQVMQSPQYVQPSPPVQQPQVVPVQQVAIVRAGADSVPQTTIVPVQQAPVQLVEHTVVYEEPTRHMSRPERRAYRARVYAAHIDSIVQSRNYLFYPNSMQEMPGGLIRSIYADYFFFGLLVDHVEVHLPTERGITQYVEMLNFDSMSIRDYRASRMQWGWCVSFDFLDGSTSYHAEFAVSTVTGETVLTLITPGVTMRYVGWLWDKRMGDPHYRRLD